MPVKKTTTSKLKDRKQALAPRAAKNPMPATKPKPAGKPKPDIKSKAVKSKPSLKDVVIDALADMKALEVKVLDVRGLTDIADTM